MGPRLTGKVVVVIGGTGGLGLSAARACVEEGAKVLAVGRNADHVAEARKALSDSGWALAGDATDGRTAEQAIAEAVRRFGRLDGLYHVAGGSGRRAGDGKVDEISDEGWDYTLQLNLTSLFYSNRAAVRHFLKENRGGSILNMTSVLGFSPSASHFATHAYAAAKAAVIGLTKSAAACYARNDIRINALAPALVETPMSRRAQEDAAILRFIANKQPLDGGRIGRVTDLDGAVLFFMSDESRFATGQVLAVDGGWCVSDGGTEVGEANA